jgi:hypothetical protein
LLLVVELLLSDLLLPCAFGAKALQLCLLLLLDGGVLVEDEEGVTVVAHGWSCLVVLRLLSRVEVDGKVMWEPSEGALYWLASDTALSTR